MWVAQKRSRVVTARETARAGAGWDPSGRGGARRTGAVSRGAAAATHTRAPATAAPARATVLAAGRPSGREVTGPVASRTSPRRCSIQRTCYWTIGGKNDMANSLQPLLLAVNDLCSPHKNCNTVGGSQCAHFHVPSVY